MNAGDWSRTPPHPNEIEVTMLGPGHGESILVHTGDGEWLVIDSFLDPDHRPSAIAYLEGLGCDPAEALKLIVATHWHDDHIRGMAGLVASGATARFCCAGALQRKEFLSVIERHREHGPPLAGLAAREIASVFAHLGLARVPPLWATANRRIHRSSSCDVWSLSPGDEAYTAFLHSLASLPDARTELDLRPLTANQLSVALLVRFRGGASCLLGADLERTGWTAVLGDPARPRCKSSVFKVPHHGSAHAHVEEVWDELLEPEPIAMLAPWRLGSGALPKSDDVARILAHTPDAYATTGAPLGATKPRRQVRKQLSSFKVRRAPESGPPGMIRLRRSLDGESEWRVDLFGSACHLKDFAA